MSQRNDSLLVSQIADGLLELERNHSRASLGCIEVALLDEDGTVLSAMGLGLALQYLSEDIHMDGDCNDISGAVRAVVSVL